jgi:L-threonylcarbamoyladenylate synthase
MASDFPIRHAAHIIRSGGIIAYPTDTIYGLGCDPHNADAVDSINLLKQRPPNKPFILLAGHIDQIAPLITISKEQKNLITQAAEPTSWIVTASPHAPAWLTDKQNSLTIRISNNAIVKKLCGVLGHAIVSTSANPAGKKPASNSLELHQYFHNHVDKILASQKKLTARPSKIIRLCDNRIIRH